MPPLVLDFETKTNAVGQRMSISERRSASLAQGDDRAGIARVVDIERKQSPEPPEVASGRVPPAIASALGLEAIEIHHHLDRPAIVGTEIHRSIGRKRGAADRAGQMGDVTHNMLFLSFGMSRSDAWRRQAGDRKLDHARRIRRPGSSS